MREKSGSVGIESFSTIRTKSVSELYLERLIAELEDALPRIPSQVVLL
jgi:hypothetical protein